MKLIDVETSTYIDFDILTPKLKAGALLRISKYKNIFARGYTPNWSKKFLRLKLLKNTTSLEIEDLYGG